MDFPFGFTQPMFMAPFLTMGPLPFTPAQPFGMMGPPFGVPFMGMPTAEQREEFSLAILNSQKQQITQMREYFQECLKSLDASLEALDQEVSKIGNARAQRQQSGAPPAREGRSKT